MLSKWLRSFTCSRYVAMPCRLHVLNCRRLSFCLKFLKLFLATPAVGTEVKIVSTLTVIKEPSWVLTPEQLWSRHYITELIIFFGNAEVVVSLSKSVSWLFRQTQLIDLCTFWLLEASVQNPGQCKAVASVVLLWVCVLMPDKFNTLP